MKLAAGTRLGPYEIGGPIGAGAMGQVYRARDTRLGREVALKVIAADAQPTAEQRQRLHREARAVAQLQHPHICSLFDVGHEQGIDYLVIELLEGETLAARLERGRLPLEQCLVFGAQMAAALAAAHARGIVHRDLKPANVMLTPTGAKLLDFGVAKGFGAASALAAETDPSQSRLTRTGMLVGTLPYVAPEQIAGEEPDARTDIFALGAVLYEMATGRPAFAAPTPAALIGAVLGSDPPALVAIRPDSPPAFDRVVSGCLAKDPAQRWHSAHDVELQLRAMHGVPREPVKVRPRPSAWVPWTLAAAALTATVVLLGRFVGTSPSPVTPIRFTVEPPPRGGFLWTGEVNPLAMSPDGRQLAFIAVDSAGRRQVWLRPLSNTKPIPLPGTSNAQSVMWSPDGRSIAFFTGDRLQRLDLPDGAPVTLTELASRSGQAGSWGRRGYILYAGVQGDAIHRVSASGGEPEVVLRADRAAGVARIQAPWYLPDGEQFLYLSRTVDGSGTIMRMKPGDTPRVVTRAESMVQYAAPGVLLFVRDGTLLGQSYDWERGTLKGEPFAVADTVRYFLSTGVVAAATSDGGTLVLHAATDVQQLVWLDRTGAQQGAAVATGDFEDMTLSPDGRRLLLSRRWPRVGTLDMTLVDLERGTETPLTTSPYSEVFGVWLPGGRSVIYSLVRGGPPVMVRRDLDSPTETRLLEDAEFQAPSDLSPDGRTLLYRRRPGGGNWDVWTMPIESGTPVAFTETPYDETDTRFSPDGSYIALISNETGRPELYVTPFPGPGERTRVSTDGAEFVRWPRAGNEIFYTTPDGKMMAVAVQTRPTLHIGKTATLFATDPRTGIVTFEVTRDAQRILAALPTVIASRQPLTVVTNWAAGVR